MPFISKAKRTEYNREYARMRRAAKKNKTENMQNPDNDDKLDNEYKIRTAADLLAIAEKVLNDLIAANLDPAITARSAAAILNSAIRIVEASNTEARISAIEERLDGAVKEISEP